MKTLALLLASSLFLTAEEVRLNTHVIDKKRQIQRELLSMELDIRDLKRLHILSQREHKPRLSMESIRSKRIIVCN